MKKAIFSNLSFYMPVLTKAGRYIITSFLLASMIIFHGGCKKYVQVDVLKDQLLSSQVFENDASSNSAIAGLYSTLRTELYVGTPPKLMLAGLTADEMYNFFPSYDAYRNNSLLAANNPPHWTSLYKVIYSCNAAIEGLSSSKTINSVARNQYLGEAKFLRAFCYFNLVNLFGDVPLLTATDVSVTANASRNPVTQVYDQIIADLKEAQALLGTGYTYSNGERTRVDRLAASALQARVYLYTKDWVNAEKAATAVISSGRFSLLGNLNGIFAKNNSEAIWQLANSPTDLNYEALQYIFTTSPVFVCTDYLLKAFEPSDRRRNTWIKAGVYAGQSYYYPYKFTSTVASSNEYNTVLRLAEQYLIRAEARTQQNNLSAAQDDLNTIRIRAGVSNTSADTQASLLDAILHERQVELFSEGAHRWYDLKRTGRVDAVLAAEKPGFWKPTASLYPIPLSDIQKNPKLTQNAGY